MLIIKITGKNPHPLWLAEAGGSISLTEPSLGSSVTWQEDPVIKFYTGLQLWLSKKALGSFPVRKNRKIPYV